MVRETSIKTYYEIIEEGLVGERQAKVLKALAELGCATDMMISEHLKFKDPNKVRPRRKDCVDMGIVEEIKTGKCPITNRTAIFWKIKDRIYFKKKEESTIKCPFCQGSGRLAKDGQVKMGWQ